MAFIWGPGGQAITTPQQAQRQRAVAEALMAQAQSPAQNWTQGLADVTGALSGTLIGNRVSEAEAAGQAGVAEALAGLSPQSGFSDIASVLSNPWVADSPGGSAIASALLQQNMQNADPLRQLQIETATEELNRMRNPPPPAPDYGFTFAPDGTLIRTDTTSGTFDPMGSYPKPDSSNGLMITTNPDGTTTVVQGDTSRFDTTAQGEFGKMFTEFQNQGMAAVSGLDTLAAMEQQMADPNFYSGFGADQLLAARQAAAAMGINPEGVTSMETFNSLSKQAALASMGGSLGAGFSNADRSFVEQQVASLASTPEGNRQLINLQRKILDRKIDIAVLANQYREQNGQLDGGFTQVLQQYAEENPLFVTEDQGGGDVDSILQKYGVP